MAVYIRGNNVENAKKYVLLCKTSNGEYEIVQHDKILNPSENINFEISNLSEKTENGFSFAPGLYFFAVEAWAEEYEKSNISNSIEYEFIDNTIYYFVNFEYKDELGNDLNNGILLTEKFAENTEFFFESKKINFKDYVLETIKINSEEVPKENNSIIINNNITITYIYKKIEIEIPSPPEDETIIEEPNSYELINTYQTNSQWMAPETGYYQIEVFGASGNGGAGVIYLMSSSVGTRASGGGGGGGGYACSRVVLNKGDTIDLTIGAVGKTTSAIVNSSYNDSYDHTLSVTSGSNGGAGSATTANDLAFPTIIAGSGGTGGEASGGNFSYINGKDGDAGTINQWSFFAIFGGAGGVSGYTGGNVGGAGADVGKSAAGTAGSGKAGFIKIYRGKGGTEGGNDSSIDPILANNSWEVISQVARAGQAQDYWQIGDIKPIIADGYTYNAQIVAFDHYDVVDADYGREKAGITFHLVECTPIAKTFDEALSYADEFVSSSLECKDYVPTIQYPKLKNNSSTSTTIYEAKGIVPSLAELGYGGEGTENIVVGTPFEYYASENSAGSTIKYKIDNSTAAINWWTRSYHSHSSSYGTSITDKGSTMGISASTQYYIAPVFCI